MPSLPRRNVPFGGGKAQGPSSVLAALVGSSGVDVTGYTWGLFEPQVFHVTQAHIPGRHMTRTVLSWHLVNSVKKCRTDHYHRAPPILGPSITHFRKGVSLLREKGAHPGLPFPDLRLPHGSVLFARLFLHQFRRSCRC